MNDNHHRHLLATFQYVDNLLSEAEQVLASVTSASPFQPYAPDSTPTQRKVIHDYIARVWEAMRRILTEQQLPLSQTDLRGSLDGAKSIVVCQHRHR